MNRRRFLRRASGLGTCAALSGCLEFGDDQPSTQGPEDLLVTSIGAQPDGGNVNLAVEVYVDRTEPTELTVEGEVSVDETAARESRTVRLSGERKRLTLQLLFTGVASYPSVPENIQARARVGYGDEMSAWYETAL
ncbi:hypothetical protein [Haloarchaeobius sp. TZWSO28]|uniref:hypothetical protein n=1 Tax=unclassified Haloarchaeobius TaxID=2614452 RepID=UPI003EBC40BA